MGLKTAHKLLRQCGSVARALSAARMEGMKVPPSYQKEFEMAEKTFVYQRVFHRSTTTGQVRMVTLTPCEGQTGVESQDCIGPLLPDHLLDSIARGDVDPITKKSLVENESSIQIGISRSKSSSFYAVSKPKWIRETQSAGQKTLDTFFSRNNHNANEQASSSSSLSNHPMRKPLGNVTNTVSASLIEEAVASQAPLEKSKYFAASPMLASSPVFDQQAQFDDLASFTPTQRKGSLTRRLSTDSGEISSPASSSIKRTRERLLSSPFIDVADDTPSPNTSPTLIRPRKKIVEGSKSPISQESDIEEDNISSSNVNNSLLAQFAYQYTPTATQGNNTLKRQVSNIAPGTSSSSSSKKRLTALLQFQNEEEDVFNEIHEQTTPLVRRTHSDSSSRAIPYSSSNNNNTSISRPYSLKRVQTSNR